jgi:hypothetical protein
VVNYEYQLSGDRLSTASGQTAATNVVVNPLGWRGNPQSGVTLTLRVRAQTEAGWGPWNEVSQRVDWSDPEPETPPETPTEPGGDGSSG